MSFRRFFDVSYALLVEGYLTIAPNHIDLLSAIEKVDETLRIKRLAHPGQLAERQSSKTVVASQNDAALEMLKARMAEVSR